MKVPLFSYADWWLLRYLIMIHLTVDHLGVTQGTGTQMWRHSHLGQPVPRSSTTDTAFLRVNVKSAIPYNIVFNTGHQSLFTLACVLGMIDDDNMAVERDGSY